MGGMEGPVDERAKSEPKVGLSRFLRGMTLSHGVLMKAKHGLQRGGKNLDVTVVSTPPRLGGVSLRSLFQGP